MNYLSVCSGIEAASVAWEPLGFKPVAFSEIEPFPSAVLAKRFPTVPNLGDMNDYESWNIGPIDILVGGTPCQSFSLAGKRESLSDERGNLCLTFCRMADKFNPKWILWENVKGVLHTKDNAFGCFLGELCGSDTPLSLPEYKYGKFPDCGVVSGPKRTVAWRVLNAQWIGVPQRRKRVFVLAVRGPGNFRCADALLPVGESLPGYFETSGKKGEKAPGSTGAGTQKSHWEGGPHPTLNAVKTGVGYSDQELFSQGGAYLVGANEEVFYFTFNDAGQDVARNMCPTLRAGGNGGPVMPAVYCPDVSPTVSAKWHKGTGGPSGDECQNLVAFNSTGFELYEVNPFVMTIRANGLRPDTILFENHGQDSRITWPHTISPTVSAKYGTGGGNTPIIMCVPIDSRNAIRRLTPRECERLQGFPDDWTLIPFGKSIRPEKLKEDYIKYLMRGGMATYEECCRAAGDSNRYKALGNSMAVPVIRYLGERIRKIERTYGHECKR